MVIDFDRKKEHKHNNSYVKNYTVDYVIAYNIKTIRNMHWY